MNRSAGPARHGFPLGRKLPLLITALLVVTLATGLAFGYAQARETALVTARERLKLLAQNLSAALGSQSPGALSSRAAVARDPAIGAFLRRQTQPSRVAAASALQPLRRPGEPELPIMLSSPGGRPLLVLGPIPAGMDADALKRTLAPGVIPDSLRFGPFVQLGGRGFFWLVTPVREGGATRGHIAELRSVAGSPSGAQQLRALIGPDIDLFLANTAGGPWVGIDGRVTPWPRGWPFSGAVRYRRHGAERFGHAAAIAGTPWSVVVEEPLQTVLARPADFLRGSSLVALILCLAGAAGAWLLSRTITGPLKQLGISADAIGRGEYARRSTLERSDELGVLAHRFDWMAEQVEMTHEELAAQHETAQGLAMELEEANQELADTQSRLDAALRHGRIGTWTWDVAVTRVWLGNGLMRLLGRAGETLAHCTPTTFLSFFHPDDRPRMQRALDEAVASGQEYEIDARVPCLDGTTLSVEIKGSAERDAEGRVWRVTGACIDVTERRELEAQLRHSQRLESVGQLAGGSAHDFNNLLTIISGNTELLAPLEPADEARELIDEVRHACERAAALTRQLLAFSRQQVLEPRVVDLNTVIGNTESMLRRLLGEDVVLTLVLGPAVSPVLVDPGYMDQVILNLAVNARDAMPRGGRLTIETAMADLGAEYASAHPEVVPGRYVQISVTDTGSGIPREVLARIFDPFFTTKAIGKGTGLGLAVVHGIVKQSGGHVQAYSEPGVGTSFKIYLAPETAPVEAQPAPPAADEPDGMGTVLVVEDEDAVRRLATRILAQGGYSIVEAGSGQEALQLVEGCAAGVDLLLTDVVMPGMSGPDLATALTLRFPQMKVLYSSGYTDDAVFRHGILASEVAFLQKPYTPASLRERVRQVMGRA